MGRKTKPEAQIINMDGIVLLEVRKETLKGRELLCAAAVPSKGTPGENDALFMLEILTHALKDEWVPFQQYDRNFDDGGPGFTDRPDFVMIPVKHTDKFTTLITQVVLHVSSHNIHVTFHAAGNAASAVH